MTLLAFAFYATIVIATAIYVYVKWKYQYWKKRNVPCLSPTFPFGNLRQAGKRRHIKDTMDETYRALKGTAPIVGMYFYTQPIPLIIDLDLIQHVLIKDFSQFTDRGLYYNERDDPLSANLVNVGGYKWRAMRLKLSPTFTSGKMKFMYPTMLGVAEQLDDVLKELLKTSNMLEIKDLLARFTTDVIGTIAFGIECNSLKDPKSEFRAAGRIAFENPRNGIFRQSIIGQFPKFALKLGMKTVRDEVSEFFMKVVRETVKFREENNVRRNDFMDLLLQLKNETKASEEGGLGNFTVEQIAAQVYIFFLAGFETSSSNMCYSLYELALNPDVQEKARVEINSVLAKHNGDFSYDALMEMSYIDRIVHESLRKYTPVVNVFREATSNYQVPNSNQIIEKGTRIFIPAYSIHHDPDIYPDPETFEPDRFLPEEIKKRHPMAFLAFGDGPRNCIGMRFGTMQSKIGLVSLLRNYRFKVCSKTPKNLEFPGVTPILISKGGLWLGIEALR